MVGTALQSKLLGQKNVRMAPGEGTGLVSETSLRKLAPDSGLERGNVALKKSIM